MGIKDNKMETIYSIYEQYIAYMINFPIVWPPCQAMIFCMFSLPCYPIFTFNNSRLSSTQYSIGCV